ncbi:MAG TPA: helix-turn-helix transcriptional regulator [Bacteroidales bacterium]|jgi:DNA-binding XRE family transcriptional regulator|nr:helix-turn-helix transcriptional regulator [Bacteroidales bacterium]HHY01239.1 helix-turn-helix transcriptional regulator [Methanothermobacter sp.]
MSTNNKLHSVNDMIDELYGKEGTPEREQFRQEAYDFCVGQIISKARKEEKITQAQLAKMLNVDRAYISRVERGIISPSASTFLRIIDALGLQFEISKTVAVA